MDALIHFFQFSYKLKNFPPLKMIFSLCRGHYLPRDSSWTLQTARDTLIKFQWLKRRRIKNLYEKAVGRDCESVLALRDIDSTLHHLKGVRCVDENWKKIRIKTSTSSNHFCWEVCRSLLADMNTFRNMWRIFMYKILHDSMVLHAKFGFEKLHFGISKYVNTLR